MSSYLFFRYIIDDNKDFYENCRHQLYKLIPENKKIIVNDENDVDQELSKQLATLKNKKIGIMLSGGMDSGCLASYLKGANAYTFRFMDGKYQKAELERAEKFADINKLNLKYVDIDIDSFDKDLDLLMKKKNAPIHSIELQIYKAAMQAKLDGIEIMVIGDAADYVFGGMDGLHEKDWEFNEFMQRYCYVNPSEILLKPVDMTFAFEKYRINENQIDFINLMHEYTDIESYASYENAFKVAELNFIDPYEILKMGKKLDLEKIRNGESKYIIRALFKKKYPTLEIPEKHPMPRPVDEFLKNWSGPSREEFRKDIDISKYSGNQKWLIYCLEKFLNMNENNKI